MLKSSKKPAHDLGKKWRSDDVRLKEQASFSSLLLSDNILQGLEEAGYKIPSPIQLEAIPVGLFGRDLLVQAKSGTGKTLVFAIIALESLLKLKHPQVLIIVPTREIALQICDVIKTVGSRCKSLSCECFIGGINIENDFDTIKGCKIVVGTPGRLKHLINLSILSTTSIRLLIIDEFDTMTTSHFKEDIDYIYLHLPKEKQVIATSATCPKELKNYVRQYLRNPFFARLNVNELHLLGMIHYIYPMEISKMAVLEYKTKLNALEKVLTSIDFTQCLVFCNLVSRVETLSMDVRKWGFTSTFISSAKEQIDRIKAINSLKHFRCRVLITSDLTARGIDAENVDLVVNFDTPQESETYFHRCGRAGRYGTKGVAVTFVALNNTKFFERIKSTNFEAYYIPDPIPTNLINIRPEECSSKIEHQVPCIQEENNHLAEISSDVKNNVNSHEENSSENKEDVKKFSSNEANKDEENCLAASEVLNSVLHNVVSNREILSNGISNNGDRETPAPIDVLQAKESYQLTNNSSLRLAAVDLDLTEEYAFNLSEAGCSKNDDFISHPKEDQNQNKTSSEEKENKENSNLDAIEKIEDDNIIDEINAANSSFFTMETSSLNEASTNSNSEESPNAFEKNYLSTRSNLNYFYLKVFKEHQEKDKDGNMSVDIKNILKKQSNPNINEFVNKTKVISREIVTKHLRIERTSISLNDENENDEAKTSSLPKSEQNILIKNKILHSTPNTMSCSSSESSGNNKDKTSFENCDSENKSVKKPAKYKAKENKYSGTTSSYSSSSLESLMSTTGRNAIYSSKSKENETEGIKTTLCVKQDKLRNAGYLENDDSKKEFGTEDEKLHGARKKIYKPRERAKIQESRFYRRETEMDEGENSPPERNYRSKYLKETRKEMKSSRKNKTKSFKDISDQHQYDQDATISSVDAYASSQRHCNRGNKRGNASNLRCGDQSYPSYSSTNFHNDSTFNCYCQQNYPPYFPYTVGSHNCKTCDFQHETYHCCHYESHNCHRQHNFGSHWYDQYFKQWQFIQRTINSYHS